MSSRLTAVRALAKIRERRGEPLMRALEQARAQLATRKDQLASATDHDRACAADEAAGHARLDALTSGVFTPDALIVMGMRLDDLKAVAQQASRGVNEAREAVERQQQAVESAHGLVRRHEQRLEAMREQVARLEREQAALMEEQADEEAEEASTARYVARTRAARAEVSHG